VAYDAALALRVRRILKGTPGTSEQAMFGGMCYLVRGHMCCGIVGDTLMVRVGPDAYEEALAKPHVREMDFTGRPLRGMVYVGPAGIADATALRRWVRRGLAFAGSLPRKKK